MSITLPNKLPDKKVKLGDGVVLKLFSIFYTHPFLLDEDGWKLLNLGEEKILVDTDSLHVFGDCDVTLKYDMEHITHVNLRSHLKGDELNGLFDDMLKYSKQVRADMNSHYDPDKVSELTSALNTIKISSDDVDQKQA